MIKILTGKYQKRIAWVLFFIFYGELAGTLYAGKQRMVDAEFRYASSIVSDYRPVRSQHRLAAPAIKNIDRPALSANAVVAPTPKDTAAGMLQDVANDGIEKVDIDGPSQPEMSTFKSVGSDNMVNLFTGDFSYSIALGDVGGYPINLFYNAGISMDQEASWVGLGWNLNPGTISRTMRGVPDDFNKEDVVTKVQSMRPDVTVGATGSTEAEITGTPWGYGIKAGIFYNNRRGLGLEAGVTGEFKAHEALANKSKDEKTHNNEPKLTLEGGIDLNSQNGMTLSGGFSVENFNKKNQLKTGLSTSVEYNSRQGVTDLSIGAEFRKYKTVKDHTSSPFKSYLSTNINFARSSFTPSINMPLTRFNQTYLVKIGREKKVLFNNGTIRGYVQEARIDKSDRVQVKPAYGYMYYEDAKDDVNALMDFNRLNDRVYNLKTPILSVPVYTYDVFSISGEGTGGSFRGYHGNMGYVRDHYNRTKTGSFAVSLDVGPGDIFHAGVTFGGVYSPSIVEEWSLSNYLRQVAAFKGNKGIYQGFYFKNPGEKAIIDEDYYNQMGGSQLIRPYLKATRNVTPFAAPGFQVFDDQIKPDGTLDMTQQVDRKRDKRTQVITTFTAEEASIIGLNKQYYSYKENSFAPGTCPDTESRTPIHRYILGKNDFYRKPHHISEIDVLEGDGKRYIYDIPVYQIKQKEVTFSTETAPNADGTVDYTDENSVDNKKGRDGFYQSETVEGYAHSFLLTGILSPDYVDVTGDGITDDDLGTAVKFNYSRVNKQTSGNHHYWKPYAWRSPMAENTATFNEGLKADKRDDKGMFTYGEKELWYLHSIESKNMVATFRISDRSDGAPVAGENGGVSVGTPGMKQLDRIDIYTKAEYLKPGGNPRPVKSIHFSYEYTLCKDFKVTNQGKLTLTAVWFSYNGNERQTKNKYQFNYGDLNSTAKDNPRFNQSNVDRWGNFKLASANPNAALNADYPYVNQSSTSSNDYANAWNLKKILLPGGGVMEISYEADDYAFVQDKRACVMTKILGFGETASSSLSNHLYTVTSRYPIVEWKEHNVVFFEATTPVTTKEEIRQLYLKDINQLLMKLSVLMPAGNVGNSAAYQPVFVYGMIKNYGLVPRPSPLTGYYNDRFYIELETNKKGGSPIMETVFQFLKDQLPQRAYPGYEVNGNGALMQVVRSVWGLMSSFVEGVQGFESKMRMEGKCKSVGLSMSFGRLNSPTLKKLGGGYRVKKILVHDNWKKMTTGPSLEPGMEDSYYGQEYTYTTTEEVNGEMKTISSGVATYEPGIGNEENPFREVWKWDVKQFLGPTQHENVEMPVTEAFFPSPMVGYSKVSVRSVHTKESKNVKSGVGMQQSEFFTARDFPVITDFTPLDGDSRHHHKPSFINKVFNFAKKDYLTLTQGFRVVLNDMNGKPKAQSSFPENDLKTPINYTRYHYRTVKVDGKTRLDNVVPVISGPDGVVTNKLIGRDVEVMNDFRQHYSYTWAANVPINGDFFSIGGLPLLIPTVFRMAFKDESRFRSATTLKVVNEFGIIESVENIDKGSRVSTKNLAYDAETGDVLISQTDNEFNKPIYQFSYPAWWANSGMEPAYRNIDLTYSGVVFRNGMMDPREDIDMDDFESGDEIFVIDYSEKGPEETAACVIGGFPERLPMSNEFRIWALDRSKDTRNATKEFIFIDRYGNPYNAANATIRIIRSGKRNLAGATVGNIVSLANPIRLIGLDNKVVIDDDTKVINASAMEYKEKWRANDQFYSEDINTATVRQTPLYDQNFWPVATYTREFSSEDNGQHPEFSTPMVNKVFEAQKRRWKVRRKSHGFDRYDYYHYNLNSWIKFDLPSGIAGATVTSATLILPGHDTYHNAPGMPLAPHAAYQPHRNEVGYGQHSASTTFKLARMNTPWYSDPNDNNWKVIFEDKPQFNYTAESVTHTPIPAPPYEFSRGFWVPIQSIAQGMVNNIGNASVAQGIKLSFLKSSWAMDSRLVQPWRYCFGTTLAGEAPGNSVHMNLKYYKCTSSDPVVYTGAASGAPTIPPTGYFYCPTYSIETQCFSVFSKQKANPYIEGVLGNFRAFRSYVFYGNRRESDATVSATKIREDGVIENFAPYWQFASSASDPLTKTGSTKWTWNSEIIQYNRRGAELENHDPLGRYNSGIYGYQESLPVAVTSNSRLRLSAFDGFEDYYYKDDPCEPFCKPSKRHFNTDLATEMLSSTQAHTGRYSLIVPAETPRLIDVKISADDAETTPDIMISNTVTTHSVTTVTPDGKGLLGEYRNGEHFNLGTFVTTRMDPYVSLYFKGGNSPATCYDRSQLPPHPSLHCSDMSVKWTGKLQVEKSGNYEFRLAYVNDAAWVTIGTTVVESYHEHQTPRHQHVAIPLDAGDLYNVSIELNQRTKDGGINLLWKVPGSNEYTPIDPKYFYPTGEESLAEGTVVTQNMDCVKPNVIQAVEHHLVDGFELVPGKKMVASLWMKSTQECTTGAYANNFKILDASEEELPDVTFVPKEGIIEGWQQFEAIFTVPISNSKITLSLQSASGDVYVDDLRFHPFNANMKSFVYDPVTLRLSAELDENNFASFYEYDDEGTLVRVKKETKKGIKTISETRSSLQKSIITF